MDIGRVLGVLIHGDAAIAGQGIVSESLGFQDLVDYTTGGIIHIVLNNQIGFTTDPYQGRSSYYCTEIAKAVDAPVIHVNGDEPDILDYSMRIAVAYRQKFKKDIFIDIIGYRRHGHNEQDQPNFTQPKIHALISDQKRDVEKYFFLKAVSPKVSVINSHLSEYGVMGFEYGYSITDPNTLVIWEAQFGDFANGAAIIIDNFLISGEAKWEQQSGLVLNLPHGMDGQGPEHSSGRIERFLHLSDDFTDT
ncbi:unnamed protein product [Sphagnum balticum]